MTNSPLSVGSRRIQVDRDGVAQERGPQLPAVGDDHERLRANLANPIGERGIIHIVGLERIDATRLGEGGDGGG